MLSVQGSNVRLCDGLNRRELLRVGGLSLFGGMSWPRLLQAASAQRGGGRARSVILFNLLGGPSHIDMFDVKPDAAEEIRGAFKPINTSLTGLQICEHLPRTARLMHRASLIRTVTHNYNAHNPLAVMTGYAGGDPAQLNTKKTDPPDIGAVCQYLGRGRKDLPGAVCMPCVPGITESGAFRRPGPYGGWLGSQYDPLFTDCQPTFDRQPARQHYDPVTPLGEPLVGSLAAMPDLTAARMDGRRSLSKQLDTVFKTAETQGAVGRMNKFQQRAFDLLSSSRTREAFDLSREPPGLRDRYGRNLYGSCLLAARRLAEAGVPFISVHATIFGNTGHAYDTHENNFGMLRDMNLPILDRGYSALIEDLADRGLLDSTLVVVMGEMGRTPKVNAGNAGRDHWPQCGFSLLTGGGSRAGCVYGTSDKIGAYPSDLPVSPADVVATIYELLGIDPHLMIQDQTGRPLPIAHGGSPIGAVMS